MKKKYIKGILTTIINDGYELTKYAEATLDVNDTKTLAKTLGCILLKEYDYTINGIDCHIYADDSGVRDETAVGTMIVEKNGKYIRTIIGNIFICKKVDGNMVDLTEEEQAAILSNLRVVSFGFYPTRYLHIKQ